MSARRFFHAAIGLLLQVAAQAQIPVITAQPPDVLAVAGGSASFSVTATGSGLGYVWRKSGTAIGGETGATFTLTNVQPGDAGSYDVVVTNASGSVTSDAAVLAVNAATGGTVVAWGFNNSGQINIPTGLTGVTALAAGSLHTVALKSDGTMVAWGNNGQGQSTIPTGLSGVVAIAAGENDTIALKGDGTVVAWGYTYSFYRPVPASMSGVKAISAGNRHFLALKTDGTVLAWGENNYGQTTVPAGLSGVTAVAAGHYHSVALKSDGTVVAWGNGQSSLPVGLSGVTGVAAGGSHTVALKSDGTLVAWGGTYIPLGLSGVASVAGGLVHTVVARSDGTVAAWGSNAQGQTDVPAGLRGVTAVAAGHYHTVVLAGPTYVSAPRITTQPVSQNVEVGQNVSLTVAATGAGPLRYQWRKGSAEIAGATNATLTLSNVQPGDAGSYQVVVSTFGEAVASNTARLTVSVPPTAPAIVTQPLGGAITSGQNHTLNVAATGTAPLGYQWYLGESANTATPIHGATSATYATPALTAPSSYWVRVTNAAGATNSATAVVSVASFVPLVALTSEPTSEYLATGGTATFRVRIAYNGHLPSAIAATVQLPADWTFDGFTGASAVTAPAVGQNLLVWTFSTFPAGELSYTFSASYPAGQTGDRTVSLATSYFPGNILPPVVTLALAPARPPVITKQPAGKFAAVDTGTTFTVGAAGAGALSYQWKKDGAPLADGGNLSGTTTATLSLANLAIADSGAYTVVVTNAAGGTTSDAATLTVIDARATHAVVGPGYVPGGPVTITQALTYSDVCSALGWQLLLPAGWSYASGGGAEGDFKPAVGTIELLEWAWETVPASPVKFTVTLNVPLGETGDKALAALAILRVRSGPASILAKRDPLIVSRVTNHSADTDKNGRFSLLELTRVIQLYNTRNGSLRTGCYQVETASEDGFTVEPTRANSAVVALAYHHHADTSRDGKISLLELTRVIELYNYRSGTDRTGQYRLLAGTEDGFAPGP